MSSPNSAPRPTHLDSLATVSDDALHANVRTLVGRSNQVLAALLAHLAEVETRGIHRERACSSLYTYCVYELRMAEDAAYKRARAARVARHFPAIVGMVAAGEIHLSGIVMLAPHLTDENHAELLARARHRTKREIARLVAEVAPLVDVPALVLPLGTELGRAPSSWGAVVAGLAGPVRELPAGDAPRAWIGDEPVVFAANEADEPVESSADASETSAGRGVGAQSDAPERGIPPQRHRVQFSAGQEYVDLLEQARDLLAHTIPSRDLAEVHLRAMRTLVADLKKRKCAATSKPRPTPSDASPATAETTSAPSDATPLRSGRAIPASVRREVWERDAARCAYVDDRGQRCRETARLELHHRVAFAHGGPSTLDNLELRCRVHNVLAAEHDFGRGFVEARMETG